jgi:hypothetical protein
MFLRDTFLKKILKPQLQKVQILRAKCTYPLASLTDTSFFEDSIFGLITFPTALKKGYSSQQTVVEG